VRALVLAVAMLLLAACTGEEPAGGPTPAPQPTAEAVADAPASTWEVEPLHDLTAVEEGEEVRSQVEAVEALLDDLDAEFDEEITVELAGDVLFAFDSDELSPDGAALVADIAEVLAFYDGVPARIEGHTDDVGGDAYNDDLSRRRADAVARALVEEHGVPAERLTTDGFGASRPRTGNGTDEGRARNRRVEVILETAETPAEREG
jgi:outer membrane protein OmpA-like peptidoglycan-associated protein